MQPYLTTQAIETSAVEHNDFSRTLLDGVASDGQHRLDQATSIDVRKLPPELDNVDARTALQYDYASEKLRSAVGIVKRIEATPHDGTGPEKSLIVVSIITALLT